MAYQPIDPTPYNPTIRQVPRGGTPVISNGQVTGYNAPQASGLFHNIYHALDRGTRYDPIQNAIRNHPNSWPYLVAAAGLGTAGAAGAFTGSSAGLGSGAGASTVNPFAAGVGLGTSYVPIGGTAAFPTAASIGAGAGVGSGAGASIGAGLPAAAATSSPSFFQTFLGQTLLNSGLNIVGGQLQNRAIQKAQEQSQKQIADRIRQALAALAPEQIMALAQQFLPQMAAQMSGAGQTAIQAVREQAARTGQLEGPRALSFEAGTRAKLASDVQQRAFEAAFNTAGAQAGAITGAPYTPIQPQTGIGDAITNSINQAYFVKALQQNRQQQAPYAFPYFGGGTPSPAEAQQFNGTPYQWPFYGARY